MKGISKISSALFIGIAFLALIQGPMAYATSPPPPVIFRVDAGINFDNLYGGFAPRAPFTALGDTLEWNVRAQEDTRWSVAQGSASAGRSRRPLAHARPWDDCPHRSRAPAAPRPLHQPPRREKENVQLPPKTPRTLPPQTSSNLV